MITVDPRLVYACITHVPLWLELPPWVIPLHLGDAQGEGRLNLRDVAPDWVPYHPVIGGSAGSFALRRYVLDRRPDATRVGLCHYRKFVSRDRITGVPDPKYRAMDVVPVAELERDDVYAKGLDPGDRAFVVSRPWRFTRLPWYRRGYLKEYARDHHVQDLLRFSAEAVEQGVLGSREVLAFFNEDLFVPGGVELGVFPADFWLEAIGQVESVTRACVERYPAVRTDYQTRAWSFCAERLGSWLLLKRLRADAAPRWLARVSSHANRRAWVRTCAGQLNLVVRDATHTGYAGGH